MKTSLTFLILFQLVTAASAQNFIKKTWKVNDQLLVHQLFDDLYLHESMLELKGSIFPCNGVIFKEESSAILLDTPSDSATTALLIDWIKDSLNASVSSVCVSHFHLDAVGGLNAIKARGISSFGYKLTPKLAKKAGLPFPEQGVTSMQLSFSNFKNNVQMVHLGKAHSKDNVVFYLPQYKTLFGGCIVKAHGADYGNLNDAYLKQWPETVENIKIRFPNIEVVVPGHGSVGDNGLLDYTQSLFQGHPKNK